jgi:hypothetical protein
VSVSPSPPAPPTSRGAAHLLAQAYAGLDAAALADRPAERYVAAHLAALRAAAAVLCARARPGAAKGPRSAWALLAGVAPDLAEWATFFAAGAGRRAAAEAGLSAAVTARDADDLLRQSEAFLGLVAALLDLPHAPPLPEVVAALR